MVVQPHEYTKSHQIVVLKSDYVPRISHLKKCGDHCSKKENSSI